MVESPAAPSTLSGFAFQPEKLSSRSALLPWPGLKELIDTSLKASHVRGH
jgi:hypothetical protein